MEHGETLIVGLGEVGAALAEVIERRWPVLRKDIEPREFDASIGVMHVCIPFQSSAPFEDVVCGYIERFNPALTIVNSTVLPGTTSALKRRTGKRVAYSPVRGKHVRMAQDLLHYVKYVAAAEPETAALAQAHFERAGMKTRRMDKPETLELAKLAETTYFRRANSVCPGSRSLRLHRWRRPWGGDQLFRGGGFPAAASLFSRHHRRPLRHPQHQIAAQARRLPAARCDPRFKFAPCSGTGAAQQRIAQAQISQARNEQA